MGALFAADASKVAHKNDDADDDDDDDDNNNNNNNNNNGRASKDLVSTLFWDFVFCGGSVKSARKWQLNTVCVVPLVLSTMGIVPNKLHGSLKLLYSPWSVGSRSSTEYMTYSSRFLADFEQEFI
jgi:hypothetical protein